jgi:hypothetical protein
MDKDKTIQPQTGTWDKLPTELIERKPKITFEVNIPVEVVFLEDIPREYPSEIGGVYYVFPVKVDNEEKVIMTSAWTLLRNLKIMTPLKNKKVKICKRLVKGKQQFEVIQVSKIGN